MAMPVVLTGTLRAVAAGDVGSGSCRCLRLYRKQRAAGQAALLLIFFFFSVGGGRSSHLSEGGRVGFAGVSAAWMPRPSPHGEVTP